MRTIAAVFAFAASVWGQAPPDLDLYYLAFLRPAADRKALEKADMERIQAAHMAHVMKMAHDGILVAAGPMGDTPTTISGIFVFKASSLEEARSVAMQDPTVVEHRNTLDIHPWRAAKDIGSKYREWRKENPDAKDEMVPYQFAILKKGPNWPKERSPEFARIMGAHLGFLNRMDAEGHLAIAGPFQDESDMAGVYAFTGPADEVRKLIDQDPAVKEGYFVPEMHRWWCAKRVLLR